MPKHHQITAVLVVLTALGLSFLIQRHKDDRVRRIAAETCCPCEEQP